MDYKARLNVLVKLHTAGHLQALNCTCRLGKNTPILFEIENLYSLSRLLGPKWLKATQLDRPERTPVGSDLLTGAAESQSRSLLLVQTKSLAVWLTCANKTLKPLQLDARLAVDLCA